MHIAVSLTAATRWAFSIFCLSAIAVVPAAAATATWEGMGLTSNFSEAANWTSGAGPTPDCLMNFPSGPAFTRHPAPFNDMDGLTVNQLNISEAYIISGKQISCKNINDTCATIATVSLPITTAGSAVLTVTVATSGATLNLAGRLSGAGPVTYSGLGIKRLNGTTNNTLSGLSIVAQGELRLDSSATESIAGPLRILTGATATLVSAPEIKNNVVVTVNGIFDLSAATGSDGSAKELIGGLDGTDISAQVKLGANILNCATQTAPTNYQGAFVGTGVFRQSSSGIQVLSGDSFPYTGTTALTGGEVHIWGQLLGSPVTVTSGRLVMAQDCSVGPVTLSGASSVLSFNETISAMTMHGTTPSLTVGSGSGFQVMSKSPTDYSTISTAAASISGAVLTVDTSLYTPTVGSVMVIIDNTGASPISGTFAGLAQSATVTSSTNTGTTFTISYTGGTGNDVTLTGATVAVDSTGPAISAMTAGSITGSGATITWTTSEVSDSQVEYGTSTAYGSVTTLNTSMVTSHSVGITGLSGSTLYHFRVLSRDAAGNHTTSADGTFTTSADVTDPVVSTITVDSTTTSGTAATINWTTDEPSDSQVEYGLTTAYGTVTTLDTSLVTAHNIEVTGLATATLYHYRVISTDADGNTTTSADGTFTTATTPVTRDNDNNDNDSDNDSNCGSGSLFGLLLTALLMTMRLRVPGIRR